MRFYSIVCCLLLSIQIIPSSVFAQKRSLDVICSNKTTGAVILRNKKCTSKENKLTNITTLRGATGAAGPSGPKGDTGTTGGTGAQGAPATLCDLADIDGVCLTNIAPGQSFLSSAQACAADGADICTDSQSWILREHGVLRSFQSWTSSFADNDGSAWTENNGGATDDHSANSLYYAPCCRTVTPSRSSDITVSGVRVVFIHDVADADWRTAATMCAAMKADLCDKSQYVILRNNGVISQRMWSSDHSDNDSIRAAVAIGSMADNPGPTSTGGFACCTTRSKVDCSVSETNGVCLTSVNNSATTFIDAAADCASQGAHICSMSQSAILRNAGVLTASANWSASGSDNDANNAAVAVGNAADDPNLSTDTYGYACCQ
jgi:hypothetical protein